MATKKFRNTKARKREIEAFSQLWKSTQSKVYYRRSKYKTDFKSSLPVQSKRDIYNMSTKEIQRVNKQLQKINQPKSNFWQSKSFDHLNVPLSKVNEMNELQARLQQTQDEIDQRNADRPIIIGTDQVSEDTVLSRKLMGKPNPTLTGNIKPYDFNKAKNMKDVESALQVRRNRLDPEWIKERQQIMQTNFINSLILLFNDEADDVVEMLKQVDPSDFYDMYEQFDMIDFAYVPSAKDTPNTMEMDALGVLHDVLQSYLDGDIDTNGKIFT